MIEAQRQLGELLLEDRADKGFLSSIIEDVEKEIRGKKQYIIILNLNTEEDKLEIKHKPIGDNTSNEYLWIGNADAAASPQWYFTSNKPDYIISQVITNILKQFPEDNDFYQRLQNIHENYFYDLGEQKGMRKRKRYIMDLHKLQLMDKSMESLKDEKDENVTKVLNEVVKTLQEEVKNKTELYNTQMSLWTLQIDSKKLTDSEVYQQQIIKDKFESIFADREEKICSLCKKMRPVTDKTTKFEFKYYMTDKIGFSSGISGDFTDNFRLCEPCYQAILAGENFIKKYAGLRIGNFKSYMVPSAIYDPDEALIRRDSPLWNEFKKALTDIKQVINEEIFLQKIMEFADKGNNYIFNIVFYEKSQASFKILKMIKDIPPSRFLQITKVSKKIDKKYRDLLGKDRSWGIDFNRIYYMLPLKISKGSPVEHRKLLNLYEDILQGNPVKENYLIRQFVKLARIHFYEQYNSYNISPAGDNLYSLRKDIFINNIFLAYLTELGLIERRKEMKTDELMLDEDFKNYLESFTFNEGKTSLFLLGYLIGEVATAQDAVLNKINFQGMSLSKVKRLVSEIFEKLRQYNKLRYNKEVYSEMKRLFDGQLEKWNLSSQENVFYILSGYAYQVRRLRVRREEKEKKKQKEKEEINNGQK